jgi:hypothetical protein
MKDAIVYWLQTDEEEIHFIDAIITAHDGLANVRRDYRLQNGKIYFKVYVGTGMEKEFLALIDRLREVARIGELIRGDGDEVVSAQ